MCLKPEISPENDDEIVKNDLQKMRVKLISLIFSHMLVAICYNELMQIVSFTLRVDNGQLSASLNQKYSIHLSKRTMTKSATRLINPNETFSACLLVMDENFRLQEWLAFAYFTLPLRYVVIAIDPRSKQPPTEKLNIFRTELNMTILEWRTLDTARDFNK